LTSGARTNPDVTVYNVSGKVDYLPSGNVNWRPVKLGTELYSGDSIKTHRKATLEIAFDDRRKNIVRIHPNTHVVISLKGNEKIELIDGEVFLLVQKLPWGSKFEIRTPTAICGARGTGSGTKANKSKTIISAYEHTSYAKGMNPDGTPMDDETPVNEGYKTVVKKFQKPSKLQKLGDKENDRWNKWKDAFFERTRGRKKVRERLGEDLDKLFGKKARIAEDKVKKAEDKTDKRGSRGGGQTEWDDDDDSREKE
jgi:hypothetical protein